MKIKIKYKSIYIGKTINNRFGGSMTILAIHPYLSDEFMEACYPGTPKSSMGYQNQKGELAVIYGKTSWDFYKTALKLHNENKSKDI